MSKKYNRKLTKQFKKDLKRLIKRKYDLNKLEYVIELLEKDEQLPNKNMDHPLGGYLNKERECHIETDWVLVYKKSEDTLYLYLMRTGKHVDVFKGY